MSFSSDLREELARLNTRGRQERETEMAVLLQNLCTFSPLEDGGTAVTFSGGNESALKKCFTLILKNVNIDADLCTLFFNGNGGKTAAGGRRAGNLKTQARTAVGETVDLPRQFTDVLRRLHLIGKDGAGTGEDEVLFPALTEGKRARAYLRGMFLCAGFMSDPSQRYHLEYRCTSLPRADQLREVLAGNDIHAGLTRRKSYYIVYIKDSGDIALLLQLMGASVSFMATENARIYKEMRNKVNRRVNCETANIGKTVASAVRQLEDIRLLRGQGILETLPEPLRQAADLREENPGASLAELGKLADPPVGRSGMNHRMRKLSELADKAREAGTETKSSGPADKAREAGEETM